MEERSRPEKPEIESEESDESENEDLDIKDFLQKKKLNMKKADQSRAGVSAEAYGRFNKKEDYVPRVVPKSQEQKDGIKQILSKSFMFRMLEDNEKAIVIDAMEEKRYKKGDYVIKQGDDGAELYLVDSGTLNCYKLLTGNTEDTFLVTYKTGMAFGE